MKTSVKNMVMMGVLAAILVVVQVGMSFLPNIELVSLLLILYGIALGRYALLPLYVFVLVEGLIYGFSLWWFNYLYVWLPLVLLAIAFRKNRSALFWALVSAVFGLCFGGLCAIPYLFIGGPGAALAYWTAGLYFDLLHCGSNFLLALLLFRPLLRLCNRLAAQWAPPRRV